MALSDDYPATAIMGIFGAAQEKRAAQEALRIMNEARIEARAASAGIGAMFKPFVDSGLKYLQSAGDAAQQNLTNIQNEASQIEVGKGLSAADEIAYKDAARLLNEQMVGTGNLRSGAAAFGQTELLRRVVADANQRNFDRRIAKIQALYGGVGGAAMQLGQVGSAAGQLGYQGQALSAQLLQTALGFAPMQANAAVRKGQAVSNELMSYGVATDEVAHTIIDAFAAYASGGMSEMGGGGGGGPKKSATSGSGGGGGMGAMMGSGMSF